MIDFPCEFHEFILEVHTSPTNDEHVTNHFGVFPACGSYSTNSEHIFIHLDSCGVYTGYILPSCYLCGKTLSLNIYPNVISTRVIVRILITPAREVVAMP